MPWLVVLGRASWVRRNKAGQTERWTAGVHEIDQETADAARHASRKIASLIVLEHEPELEEGRAGPLTAEDVMTGRNWGVAIRATEAEAEVEDIGRYDFTCRMCPPDGEGRPVAFASRGRLQRHQAFHHG